MKHYSSVLGSDPSGDKTKQVTEAETKSFLGGSKLSSGTRRTYFDFYYDTKKKLFTYIRPSRLLRWYMKKVPKLYAHYKITWTKMRRWAWALLRQKFIVSPYVYLRLPNPTTFQLIFLAEDLTKWDLKIDLITGKVTFKNWGKTDKLGKSSKKPDKYRKK